MKQKKTRRKGKALSDSDLIASVSARKTSALGAENDGNDLSDRREENLKRYLGRPYGDERTGQSKVVTRECLEAVEWSIPSLMRIFASSDQVVEFRPVGPEDENAAKQETSAVNHVFSKENEGFANLYTFIKSILMYPVGYIKAYWEEAEEVTTETYHGLFEDSVAAMLEDDDELEAIEQEEAEVEYEGQMIPCYTVKFRRTHKTGKLIVEPIPPEELSISGKWTKVSLQGCDYIGHTTYPTRTDLIARGYDKDMVNSLLPTSYGQRVEQDEARERHDDTVGSDGEYDEATDQSTETVQVDEHYLYIDYDGDGSAEYRLVAISGDHVLENEEIEDHPFISGCAVPVPFTHVGLAWQELVQDLQKVYTTLTRQFLNNIYRTNNPRTVVGRGVNLNDIINDLPNSPIRAKDVNQLRVEPTQSVVGNIAPSFEMLDRIKESRTGVSKASMGLDADALARVANGAYFASLEQANQRLEMLARIIAEFSIKPLFLKIHRILLTHQKDVSDMKLSGEWVKVNPAEWRERKDMDILVGLGTGNKQAQAMALEKVMEVQGKLKAAGSLMVSDRNIFNSVSKLVMLADLSNPENFFTDPDKVTEEDKKKAAATKAQSGDAALAAAEMKKAEVEGKRVQMEHEREVFDLKQKAQKTAFDNEQKIRELQAQLATKGRELQQGDRKLDIDEYKAETSAEIDSAKVLQDDEKITKINTTQTMGEGNV